MLTKENKFFDIELHDNKCSTGCTHFWLKWPKKFSMKYISIYDIKCTYLLRSENYIEI